MRMSVLGVAVLAAGCGVAVGTIGYDDAESGGHMLASTNGMSSNALRSNALRSNALRSNALRSNALRSNGLNGLTNVTIKTGPDSAFDTWYGSDPYNSTVMKYVVECAYGPKDVVTYAGSITKNIKVCEPMGGGGKLCDTVPTVFAQTGGPWAGMFNLAPGGINSERDEEAMTACLMAHVNALGTPVWLSFRCDEAGCALTPDAGEFTAYPNREGAFFGNIFKTDDAGVPTPTLFTCAAPAYDQVRCVSMGTLELQCDPYAAAAGNYTRGRSCATSPNNPDGGNNCGMAVQGPCSSICKLADSTRMPLPDASPGNILQYVGCTVGGHTYADAFTTYLAPFCGDGVCSGSETPITCSADCQGAGNIVLCGGVGQPHCP